MTAHAPADPAFDAAVLDEQLRLMLRNMYYGAWAGVATVPIFGYVLFFDRWPRAFALNAGWILLWLSATLWTVHRGRAGTLAGRALTRQFVVCAVATGAGWGSLAVSFMTPEPTRIATLFCLVLAQMVSVASGMACVLPVAVAFIVPMALLFIGPALLQSSPFGLLAGGGAVIMLALMLGYAREINRVIVRSIQMRFENRALNEALTEQRIRERTRVIEEASRHKSEFLANMSHELRTPLNAIIGYSEMLQEDAEDQGAHALVPDLKKIHGAGRHLLEMINSVLDLSKIEAGRMEVLLEDFEFPALAAEVGELVQPLARRNNNLIEIGALAGPARLRGDAGKLRQVLLNLMANACKFTRDGLVRLDTARETQEGREWLVCRVADTGIGLTPEQIGRLFQDFAQGERGTSRQYGGTGLGLALSRRLCRLMGGDITVQSTPGTGSTFTARVPLEAALTAAPLPPAAPSQATVLVIDDDAVVRGLLARFLDKEGFRVLLAENGEQGLALARREQPDMITLDLMMSGMDGWSVLAAASADAALAGIPIVILSMLDDHRAGYALGASDYLTKPIDRDRLLAALRRHRRERPVLVVDDDPMMRTLLRRMLEAEGHAVLDADSGQAALARLAEQAPGMILLDLLMPGMDGFEFLATMRLDPRWHDIPVAIVTAKEMTAEDRQRLNGSVVRVLQKCATGHDRMLAEVRSLVAASLDRRQAPAS